MVRGRVEPPTFRIQRVCCPAILSAGFLWVPPLKTRTCGFCGAQATVITAPRPMTSAASVATVTAAERTASGTTTKAAAIYAVTIDAVSGARHVIRVSSNAASSSPAVTAATR